jgi:hypothetical protein
MRGAGLRRFDSWVLELISGSMLVFCTCAGCDDLFLQVWIDAGRGFLVRESCCEFLADEFLVFFNLCVCRLNL